MIRSFFNDRRALILQFRQHFTQGLPKGSVLAPLLSLFYLNNLASSLNDDAVIALFADDFSILTTPRKKEDDETATHSAAKSVVTWSKKWKLSLSAEKSEVCLFSTWFNNSIWTHTILLVLRKFMSTLLLIVSALFWTEVLRLMHTWRNLPRCFHLVFVSSEPWHTLLRAGPAPL